MQNYASRKTMQNSAENRSLKFDVAWGPRRMTDDSDHMDFWYTPVN